ncbi:hypothetical protein DAPPUDRAFT_327745 [Daphnia pulex]|uniref:Replication protein A OB domain-containing protein n=1 Tax=Daphnia pulex TaxID=6669 RepID=E9HBM3_DAPPU|nr:hypothetical protein DAPPUDRAFT_327745 [Daphnia pulex]|eukprot:EFX70872.1 hypothetical protein DAPPUDRAFT_327745 [Daphnia pulex]
MDFFAIVAYFLTLLTIASKADEKKEYEIILWDIVPLVPGSEVGEMLGNPQTLNDDGEVAEKPTITFKFVPFDQLPNLEDDSIVDVIGLVLHLQEMVLVKLSLLEKVEDKCIVALSGVKISNKFGRRYLETLSSTVVQVNPDMSEARELREWYYNRRNVV